MTDEPSVSQQAQGSYIAQATHGGTATVQVVLPPAPVQEQNRVRFLKRLRYLYDELWEQSLQGAALLTLGLVKKPDAVLHHTGLLLLPPQQPERPLPPSTSITQVYDESGQELLILGEPGAGKSTLLLDLARQLVGRAEQDAGHPLPVILPLSSWAEKKPPLTEWLTDQLSLLYDVPSQVCRVWVHTNQILPLLDGLDEVPQGTRSACIEAITTYRKEHLISLVVCSRRTEYEELARQQRLVLHSAVVVQPLTSQQVETYLIQAGQSLAAVRTALHANPMLQELTTTPLMLNILTLAYADAAVQDLPHRGSAEVQQQQVFASYVERMVERKGNVVRYPLQSTRVWLGWLAGQMREHNQTVFYLEHLQPDWLTPGQYRTYAWLAVHLPGILIGVLASLSITLLFGFVDAASMILYGAFGGLLGGLLSGAPSRRELLSQQMGVHRRQGRGRLIGGRIAISVIIGIIVGLGFGLDLGSFRLDLGSFRLGLESFGLGLENYYGPSDWLRDGSIYGVLIGLSSLPLQFMSQVASQHTLPSGNSLKHQWKRFVRLMQTVHVQRALLVAAGVGLSAGLSAGLRVGPGVWLIYELIYGLSGGLIYGLSGGLIYGLISVLVSQILEVQAGGIHLTERLRWTWGSLMRGLLTFKHTRTTLLLASAIAVSLGLNVGLKVGLSSGPDTGTIYGLSDGLSAGLSVGLSYWILLGLFQGISGERIEDRFRRVPNQGIRRSFRNSAIMGIISGGVIWMIGTLSDGLGRGLRHVLQSHQLVVGLSSALNSGLNVGLRDGWHIGVYSGLLVCAVIGGLAVLRHVVLRLLLWHSHTCPWNAPRFLDDATARILLRRVSGGYSFVHQLILDYFASWGNMPTEPTLSHLSREVPSRVCECGYQEIRPGAHFCPSCGRPIE